MVVRDGAAHRARIYSSSFTGNADMPYDFFMSRYKEAYVQETLAFVDSLVNDKPSPCSGKDGLIALIMAIAAGKSAEEKRWVKFEELAEDLCAMSDNDTCQVDIVSDNGALNFETLLSPSMGIMMELEPKVKESWARTPAKLFERIAGAFERTAVKEEKERELTRK